MRWRADGSELFYIAGFIRTAVTYFISPIAKGRDGSGIYRPLAVIDLVLRYYSSSGWIGGIPV